MQHRSDCNGAYDLNTNDEAAVWRPTSSVITLYVFRYMRMHVETADVRNGAYRRDGRAIVVGHVIGPRSRDSRREPRPARSLPVSA